MKLHNFLKGCFSPGFDHGHLEGDVFHNRRIQQPGLLGSVGHSASLPVRGLEHVQMFTSQQSMF